MCSLVKQNKALDEAPHPVETGKQRLFQFKKEVFDQNSSKGGWGIYNGSTREASPRCWVKS